MQVQGSPRKNGLVIVDGYAIRITVEHRRLVVSDGAPDRQERRFHRATARREIRRMILIGHSGMISLDALRWLRQAGASLINVDPFSADLVACSAPAGTQIPQLRRAQALAPFGPAGVEVARYLIGGKIAGQAGLLGELPGGEDAREELQRAQEDVETARSIKTVLAAEARAAAGFWAAWHELPVRFARRDQRRIPERWKQFETRASPITGGPRLAADPANAVANFLAALIEGEATIALFTAGLDPTLAVLHSDQQGRRSMALDCMEPVRPLADAYLLELLRERPFSARDFIEEDDGSVRLARPLARSLAGTIGTWREHVGPVVEQVAGILAAHAIEGPIDLARPLTRGAYRAAWERRKPDRKTHQPVGVIPRLPSTCRNCGIELPNRRVRYCQTCRAERFTAQAEQARARGQEVLAARCGQGSRIRRTAGDPDSSGLSGTGSTSGRSGSGMERSESG
jgi:CRISPR-associated endonuclease Cas1